MTTTLSTTDAKRSPLQKALRATAALAMVSTLSGCLALPPALQLASLALDGYSYVTTGKTVGDHALSAVAEQDCAMVRALKGDNICVDTVEMDVAKHEVAALASEDEFTQLSEAWLTANLEPVNEMPYYD